MGISSEQLQRLIDAETGGGGGGGASTIADGADVTQGAIADAAVAAGATGSQAAKLRAVSRDVGALTETAPGTDTASSGLNGRLQRIAQRLTSLIALLPASVGQKTMAASLAVTMASDQSSVPAAGDVAAGSADSGNPLKMGAVARTADSAVTNGQRTNLAATLNGKQIVKLDAIPDLSWNYAAAAGGLVSTAGVTAKAAGGAGVRNYVKACQVVNSHPTISTEILIRDGASGTVLHRGWAQASGGGFACVFDPPLRGTAATLVEIAEVTATASTGVLVNLQGYQAAE